MAQLQKDVKTMKQEIEKIKKVQRRTIVEPIIIEKISDNDLTSTERRHIKEARADIKAGRMEKFVTLEELEASIRKRKKSSS